jgi:peptidoglycan/LPS O-acetylase OafA/YrhL
MNPITTIRWPMRPANLLPLTTLRLFAAAAIVIFHLPWHDFSGQPALGGGVTFFYILSGFILSHVHFEMRGMHENMLFWIARFARIWPVHFFTFLLLLASCKYNFILGQHYFVPKAALNLSLLQAWIPASSVNFSFNGVSWSLSCESFFYFLFPFVLPLAKKYPFSSILISFVISLSVMLAGKFIFQENSGHSVFSANSVAIVNPVCRLFNFVLGCSTYMIWQRWPFTVQSNFISKFTFWTIVEIGVLAAVGIISYLLTSRLHLCFGSIPAQIDWLEWILISPIFAIVIWVFAFQGGFISKVFSWRILCYGGEISFSIYMVHQIVFRFASDWFGFSSPHPIAIFFWIIVSLILAMLIFHFVEVPARRWIIAGGKSYLKRI